VTLGEIQEARDKIFKGEGMDGYDGTGRKMSWYQQTPM
jgi:hypothetical protein